MTSPLALAAFLPLAFIQPPLLSQSGQDEAERPKDPSSLVLTIVEEGANRPIPGAAVFEVREALFPTWGSFQAKPVARADENGQVRLDGADGGWVIVKAEGFGARGQLVSGLTGPIGLTREVPITIQVVDYLGLPVALAHLGVCVGCGHTPDVLSATTGPDGRATLRGAAPDEGIVDLYVVHPDLIGDSYDSVPFDAVDANGVARVQVMPGTNLEGQVVYADGSPAAGVGVGWPRRHRGPWTTTDRDGHFNLFGLPPKPTWLEVKAASGKTLAHIGGSRAGIRRTLTIHRDKPGAGGEYDLASFELESSPMATIQVHAALEAGEPVSGVLIEAWDPQTGWCRRERTGDDGYASVVVPANRVVEVEVGDPAGPYSVRNLGSHTIQDGHSVTLEAQLPAPRVAAIRLLGVRPYSDIYLLTAGGAQKRRLAADRIDALEANQHGHTVIIQDVSLPSGRWSIAAQRRDSKGTYLGLVLPASLRDLGEVIEVDLR